MKEIEEKESSMEIEKVYEDNNVVVINKPSGIISHSDGKTEENSVSSWFAEMYPGSIDVGEGITLEDGTCIEKPGIVHRLDRDTSGVMVLPKNQETFNYIKEQFQARKVEKIYRAFVYGKVKEDAGVIDRPIGRSAKDFRMKSAQRGARGKLREAITHYTVLGRGKETTFLELRPKTGRTHQIRVHMKAVNHPVVCDSLYAPKHKRELGFKRLALHSSRIELEIEEGKHMSFEAPLPADFVAAQSAL